MGSNNLDRGNAGPGFLPELITVTYTEMQGLIAAGDLVSSTWYFISDATQAVGGFGGIYVQAIDSNTLETRAQWEFTTNVRALGWLDLGGTMIAGDQLTAINVNAINQLGAAVFFTTTYTQLAIDAAASINANGAALVTAFAIRGRLILTYKTATTAANGFVVAGTGTNFVAANISNLGEGQNPTTKTLLVNYQVTTNQVMQAEDVDIDFLYSVTAVYIAAKGYNPIYRIRWGEFSTTFNLPQFYACRWVNIDLTNFYYKNSIFSSSVFEENFNFANTSNTVGCSLNFVLFQYCELIYGTITFAGFLCNYTSTANGISFSRILMWNNSVINFTNTTMGGNFFTFSREMYSVSINLSNSTITPNANSSIFCAGFGSFTCTGSTITGTISVITGVRTQTTANNITYAGVLMLADENGQQNVFTFTGAAITGNISITTGDGNTTAYNFTNTVISGAVTLTGMYVGSTINLNGSTFANLTATGFLCDFTTITGTSTNFGLNSLIFTNATITNNAITIPALTANFDLTGIKWLGSIYKAVLYRASAGIANTDILFMRIPPKFSLCNITFEFAALVGVGCLLQAEIQSGTPAGIMPATAVATLTGTMQGPGTVIVPAISGAVAAYKGPNAWDYIVIVPTGADLASGTIGINLEGFVSQI